VNKYPVRKTYRLNEMAHFLSRVKTALVLISLPEPCMGAKALPRIQPAEIDKTETAALR
jgi:hypothetical protein